MTGPQKEWLDSHRAQGYRPIGTTPGGGKWISRGMLHPDGSFEPLGHGRPAVRQGSFEVGILQHAGSPDMQGPV